MAPVHGRCDGHDSRGVDDATRAAGGSITQRRVLMTTVRALAQNERGAIAVLFAVLTPALIFLFLLVIDVGNWYVHKRHLQMEVDAAALAGGAYFGDCFSSDPSIAGAKQHDQERGDEVR